MFRQNYTLLLFLFLVLGSHISHSQKGDLSINYKIKASVDVSHKKVAAEELIHVINNSRSKVDTLYFHTWMNAFSNEQSDFSRQLLSQHDYDFHFRPTEDKGGYSAISFYCRGEAIQISYKPYDQVIALPLSKTLSPGDSVIIKCDYEIEIPRQISRVGYDQEMIQLTHWYPKLALRIDGQWDTLSYLNHGEFSSPYANYNVDLKLSNNATIATPIATITDTKSHRVNIKNIIDLPLILYTKETQHNQYNHEDVNINITSCRNAPDWSGIDTIINDVIDFYQELIGPLPYNFVQVAQGPEKAYSAMEYPGLILLNGTMNQSALRYYIAHEIAHQYFYAGVALNERHEAYMDEGLATYMTAKYMKHTTGSYYYNEQLKFLCRNDNTDLVLGAVHQHLSNRRLNQQLTIPPIHLSSINYGLNNYAYAANKFLALERQLGQVFTDRLKSFYKKYKFKHSNSGQFFDHLAQGDTSRVYKYSAFFFDDINVEDKTHNESFVARALPKVDNIHSLMLMPLPLFNYNDGLSPSLSFYNNVLSATKWNYFGYLGYGLQSKSILSNVQLSYDHFPSNTPNYLRTQIGFKRHSLFYNEKLDYALNYNTFNLSLSFHQFNGKLPSSSELEYGGSITAVREDFARFSSADAFEIEHEPFLSLKAHINYRSNKPLAPSYYRASIEGIPSYGEGEQFIRVQASMIKQYYFSKNKYVKFRFWGGGFVVNSKRDVFGFNSFLSRGALGLFTSAANDYDYQHTQIWRSRDITPQLGPMQGGLRIGVPANLNIGQSNNIAFSLNTTIKLSNKLPIALYADIGGTKTIADAPLQYYYVAGLTFPLLNNGIEICIPVLTNRALRNSSSSIFSMATFRINTKNLSPRYYLDNLNRLFTPK